MRRLVRIPRDIASEIKRMESHVGRFDEPLLEKMHPENKLNRALITAANKGALGEVRALVKRGAEPASRNGVGMRAIDCARLQDYTKVVEFLEAELNKNLFYAIKENDFELFEKALEGGADPDALCGVLSALVNCIGFRRWQMAEVLIEKGADVRKINEHGHSPLMMAVMVGDLKMVKLLVEKGADPYEQNRHTVSAKSLAESQGHVSMVDYFEGNGKFDRL